MDNKREFSQLLLARELKSEILLEVIAESVVMVDASALIIYVNNRACELFGYEKDELIGRSLNMLIPAAKVKIHDQHLMNYFKNPQTRTMGIGLNLAAIKKNGIEFPVEISLTSIQTTLGRVAMALISDISIRKKAEDELKERNEELDAFAHTLAHDLTSLLNSNVGFSDMLLKDDTVTQKEREYLTSKIYSHSLKMSRVVKEILAFASIRREEVELSKVNMKQVINEAIDRVQNLAKEHDAKIIFKNELHNCMGYASWLEEVWYNLLSNAIKYGGRPPLIEIGSEVSDNNKIIYRISDNGKGLTQEEQELLFNAPHKVKNNSIAGHGFGLSIVNKILKKIDGEIRVNSEKNKGTWFAITLGSLK